MKQQSDKLLRWTSRILGILVCLFLSVFALDAFGTGKSVLQSLPDFAIHIIPVIILLAIVALSWRREWIGAFVFMGLAAIYAVVARRHVSWIATVSGPLFVVGGLFLLSWMQRRKVPVTR